MRRKGVEKVALMEIKKGKVQIPKHFTLTYNQSCIIIVLSVPQYEGIQTNSPATYNIPTTL